VERIHVNAHEINSRVRDGEHCLHEEGKRQKLLVFFAEWEDFTDNGGDERSLAIKQRVFVC